LLKLRDEKVVLNQQIKEHATVTSRVQARIDIYEKDREVVQELIKLEAPEVYRKLQADVYTGIEMEKMKVMSLL
jgi:hypothetical protein